MFISDTGLLFSLFVASLSGFGIRVPCPFLSLFLVLCIQVSL